MRVESRSGTGSRVVRWMRPLALIVLALLAAQFLVGMVVNLFVQVPDAHPGAQAGDYFAGVGEGVNWALQGGGLPLQAHVILGLLLFVGSVAILALAVISRQGLWIVTGILGWVGIMEAGFNGASFINYGHDVSSLLMSIGFLLAVIAYAAGLCRAR